MVSIQGYFRKEGVSLVGSGKALRAGKHIDRLAILRLSHRKTLIVCSIICDSESPINCPVFLKFSDEDIKIEI